MSTFRRFTLLFSAVAILLLGVWGCSQGTGTESDRDRDRQARDTGTRETGSDTASTAPTDDTAQHNADNTARNENPQYQQNPPFEQGNSQADLDLTQRVRKAVTDDTTLSTTAKNVKIISRDGKVLLMGPVQSDAERQRIETIANQVAGNGNVTNQLEVKAQY